MELTLDKAIQLHKSLWNWLAETGAKRKSDWPEWEKYGYVRNDCFACEYATTCFACPFQWIDGIKDTGGCCSRWSTYRQWVDEPDTEKRKELAKRIANLPLTDVAKAQWEREKTRSVSNFLSSYPMAKDSLSHVTYVTYTPQLEGEATDVVTIFFLNGEMENIDVTNMCIDEIMSNIETVIALAR